MDFDVDALKSKLFSLYEQRRDEFVAARWHFHRHPELSRAEEATAAYVSARLTEAGVPHRRGIAGHGIAAYIRGASDRPLVAFRGDMDALLQNEATGLPYASENPGVMHACGHDFHTAALLALGVIAHETRQSLPGSVLLLFQPAEEGGPPGGAQPMIDDGVFERGLPDAIFGAHVFPDVPKGCVGIKPGVQMAAVDNFYITVLGRGGHGGHPHSTLDPMPAAAQIILGASALVARTVSPTDSAVITIGKVEGGTKRNVVADSVTLSGTMRTLLPQTRAKLTAALRSLSESTCAAYGLGCKIVWKVSFDPVDNDKSMTDVVISGVSRVLGRDFVHPLELPYMTGEDFSAFLKAAPGAFYLVGCGEGDLHSATLAIDDDVLDSITRAHIAVMLEYFSKT